MYRHIPSATQYGEPVSAHHYINESRPDEQFMIEIQWSTMTVHVKTLADHSANEWTTVSVTPLSAHSPAEAPPIALTKRETRTEREIILDAHADLTRAENNANDNA